MRGPGWDNNEAMSDLQCPCLVTLIAPDASGGWAQAYGGKHLAGVFVAGPLGNEAREVAARLAREISSPLESMADVVDGATLRAAIDHLGDLYRGETIAVVTTAALIAMALGSATQAAHSVTLAIDASGWTVVER